MVSGRRAWQAWGVAETVFGCALLVSGPEAFLAERVVAARVAQARAERPEAELNRLDASETDGHQLAQATGGSLFAADAIAVVDDIGSLDPKLADNLVALASAPGDALSLVLVHAGGNKGRALLDQLRRARVETVRVETLKPYERRDFAREEASRAGLSIAPDALEAMLDAVGADTRSIVGAVEQLASDAAGARVDRARVARYFAGQAGVNAFAVADAVMASNTRLALEKLRWALDTGVAHVLVTGAMAKSLRTMGKLLDALDARVPERDLPALIEAPPWKCKGLIREARSWDAAKIADAIEAVCRADAEVKGAAQSADYALESMVLRIATRRPAA